MSVEPSFQRPRRSEGFPWYDSLWLDAYHHASQVLRERAPGKLAEFEHAMDVFRTDPHFRAHLLQGVFDEGTLADIRETVRLLAPTQLELHEAKMFKRFVVHDHARFAALHQRLVDRVSEAAGEAVEPSYNFLSLYGAGGVCAPHMDAPIAKWTLDLCVNQSDAWPIAVGPIVTWPQPGQYGDDWQDAVRREAAASVQWFAMQPGEALLFSGSSQWHYRDVLPQGSGRAHCDLLFFHFIPKGTSELVRPGNWGRLFGVPELTGDPRLERAN